MSSFAKIILAFRVVYVPLFLPTKGHNNFSIVQGKSETVSYTVYGGYTCVPLIGPKLLYFFFFREISRRECGKLIFGTVYCTVYKSDGSHTK
jgi:hypothetical protein